MTFDREAMGLKAMSLHWSDIPGYRELVGECPNVGFMLGDEKDMLDEFILRNRDDERNPTDISAYVSRFKGIVLVFYRDRDSDDIRFIHVLPDSEHNRRYVIYDLSRYGSPQGMVPDYRGWDA